MNRSLLTALILSAGVCTTVYGALAAKNKRLSDQLAAEQGVAEQGRPSPAGTVGSKSIRRKTPPLSSEEKVGRASERVARFTASLVPPDGSKAKELTERALDINDSDSNRASAAKRIMFWENLPDLLGAVEGLSVDELLAVAADVPKAEKHDIHIDTRAHLIMLAAEQDPMRVYRDEKLMEGMDPFAVLRCLAMVDPAEAMRLLPEIVPPKDMDHGKKRKLLGATMLGSDVDLGLRLILEARENDPGKGDGMDSLAGGLKLGLTPLRPEAIPQLVEAMSDPEFEGIRNDLIKTTLDHHLTETGVAEAARQARAMDLTPEEVDLYLDSVGEVLIATEPEAMIDWMSRSLTANQQSRRIPEAVVEWANWDVDAAATWLGAQEPSPVLDRTIASFATEASELDPDAAVAWARQIEDEQLREETLRRVNNR